MWKYEIFPTAKILREITLVWCGTMCVAFFSSNNNNTLEICHSLCEFKLSGCLSTLYGLLRFIPGTRMWGQGWRGSHFWILIFGFLDLDFWIFIQSWHDTAHLFFVFTEKKHTHFTESSSLSWGELFLLQFLEVVQARPLNDSVARNILNNFNFVKTWNLPTLLEMSTNFRR